MTVTDLLQVVLTRLNKLFVTGCYELVVVNLLRAGADDIRLVAITQCCASLFVMESFHFISRATVRPAVEPIQEKSTENTK